MRCHLGVQSQTSQTVVFHRAYGKLRQLNPSDQPREPGTDEPPPQLWRIPSQLLHNRYAVPLLLGSRPESAKNDGLHCATVTALRHHHLSLSVNRSISNQRVRSLQQPLPQRHVVLLLGKGAPQALLLSSSSPGPRPLQRRQARGFCRPAQL